jgi:S-adenosylhomocysteine hydrolase
LSLQEVRVPTSDDYKIADISLDRDQREIAIAETKMRGLMALDEEFGASRPLMDARVVGACILRPERRC